MNSSTCLAAVAALLGTLLLRTFFNCRILPLLRSVSEVETEEPLCFNKAGEKPSQVRRVKISRNVADDHKGFIHRHLKSAILYISEVVYKSLKIGIDI